MGAGPQGADHLRDHLRRAADPDHLRAQADGADAEPLRAQPRRAVRADAAAGRDRQVRDQGAVPPDDVGRLPVPHRADDRDPHRGRLAGDHPLRQRPAHLRRARRPLRHRRLDRPAVRVRVRWHRLLRDHARRLGLGLEVLIPGRDARCRSADLLRGLPGPGARRRDHHRRLAVADQDRPRPGRHVVRHPAVRGLPDLHDGLVRGDQPRPVRRRRGRLGDRRRLLHRVRRHRLRRLPCSPSTRT